MARVGSMISIVSVSYFLAIVWEGFSRHRPALNRKASIRSLEIIHSFPPINHRYNRCPQIMAFGVKLYKLRSS